MPQAFIDSELQWEWIRGNRGEFLAAVVRSVRAPLFRQWTLPGMVSDLVGAPHGEGVGAFRYPVPGLVVVAAGLLGTAAILSMFSDGSRVVSPGSSRLRSAAPSAILVTGIAVVSVLFMYLGEALALTNVAPQTIPYMEGRYFLPLLPMVIVPLATASDGLVSFRSRSLWLIPAGSTLLLTWWASALLRAYL